MQMSAPHSEHLATACDLHTEHLVNKKPPDLL